MTNETNRPVEIGQGDREAYLQWNMLPEFDAADVRAGLWDNTIGMQILARHAASAREEALKEAADFLFGEAAGALADEAERDSFVLTNAAHAIRALSIVGEGD